SGQEVQDCCSGQIRIDSHLAGQVSGQRARRKPFGLTVVAEQGRRAARRSEQIKEDPNGCGFAGAIQSEKAQYLAFVYVKVEISDGGQLTILLAEPAY